jgi:O-antigen/teichoic acid export membrane protein
LKDHPGERPTEPGSEGSARGDATDPAAEHGARAEIESSRRDEGEGPSGAAASDVAVVAKGGAVQITGQVTQRGLTFVFSAVAFRILEKGGFGLYSQIARVLTVAGQLGLAGFNYASMRFIARARVKGDHGAVKGAARVGLWGAAVASSIIVIVVLLGADPIAAFFNQGAQAAQRPEFARLMRIGIAYVPLFAFMQVLRYCTQAYKTMVPSVIVGNIVQPTARFVLGAALLLAGFEVAGAVTSLAASMGVGALAGAWYFRRILTAEQARATPRFETGAMTRFALPQAGSSLLGIQSLGLGIIVLGALLESDGPVGLFTIALALQGPGGVFLSGLVNIWAPVVSDLYERGAIERLDSLYKTITRWIVTFSLPVYAALILEPDLFGRLYGSGGVEAADLIAVLAIGNIFYSSTGPTGYVLSMTGRPGVNFANSIVAVGLYVAGGMLFVPKYGALGMAWVDAAVTALVNVVRVIEAKLLVGVQPFGRSIAKPVGATLAAALILLAWRLVPGDSIPLGIAGLVIAGASYVALLARLGLDDEERYVWERIKSRALRRGSKA